MTQEHYDQLMAERAQHEARIGEIDAEIAADPVEQPLTAALYRLRLGILVDDAGRAVIPMVLNGQTVLAGDEVIPPIAQDCSWDAASASFVLNAPAQQRPPAVSVSYESGGESHGWEDMEPPV